MLGDELLYLFSITSWNFSDCVVANLTLPEKTFSLFLFFYQFSFYVLLENYHIAMTYFDVTFDK